MAELVDFVEGQSQPSQSDHEVDDKDTLKLLDSLDDYMTLLDSLSSKLGQGWLQLASARHSMGASRINSALLNLKPHNAPTKLQVTQNQDEPQFTLCKWASCTEIDSEEADDEDDMPKMIGNLTTDDTEKSLSTDMPALDAEQQVQRERLKSLAVFGALVPPRIRDSQVSFEKALEILIDIANARSSMLCAFGKLQKETKK
ncbi:hypothetical protein V2J09_016950 [Rumex salicifolius]